MGNLQLYSLETLLPGTVRAHALPVNDPSRIPDAHQVTIFHTPHPRLHDHLVQDSGEEMFYKTLTDVKFAAANERLLTSSMDGSVAVWSLEGRLQKIFHGSAMDADSRGRGVVYERMHRGEDQSVEAGIASRVAASAAPNDTLRNGRARPTPTKPVPSVNRLVLHPEQSHVVASCMSDGTAWLWDVRDHCDSPALMSTRGEGRRLWGTDNRVIVPGDDKTHGAPVGEHFRHYYGGGLIGQERMLSCSDAVFGRGPSRDRLFAAYEQNEQTHSNSSVRGVVYLFNVHLRLKSYNYTVHSRSVYMTDWAYARALPP